MRVKPLFQADYLYSPYFEYEIVPDEYDPLSAEPDILILHFKRSADMVTIDYRYPYDIAVIADDQKGDIEVETPLLIDPNTDTKGVFTVKIPKIKTL